LYDIDAEEVVIGEGVVIEEGVTIRGWNGTRARRVVLGDHVFIGHHTTMQVDEVEIGDYSAIHNHTYVAGGKPCRIGHCCWIGQNTILNCTGGLTLGNGVGVGAYSQLWSHIKHGDRLEGCRFYDERPLVAEDDVWFVGHCIVSPITARAKSMAMVGAVVARDMEANHVYAGVPAKDVTEKFGTQFTEVPVEEKYGVMQGHLDEFHARHPEVPRGLLRIARSPDEAAELAADGATVFDVSTRRYTKRRTEAEFQFMRDLVRATVKFYPAEVPDAGERHAG
jgi:acetyltransferase-like isoleucine patch superfamily enzyme